MGFQTPGCFQNSIQASKNWITKTSRGDTSIRAPHCRRASTHTHVTMSAMTTMSAAFCVKAPVASKASAKVRQVAALVHARCRRARTRVFFRAHRAAAKCNAPPSVADRPHPLRTNPGCVRCPRQGVQGFRLLRQVRQAHRRRRHVRRDRRHHREDEDAHGTCNPVTFSWGFGFEAVRVWAYTTRATCLSCV